MQKIRERRELEGEPNQDFMLKVFKNAPTDMKGRNGSSSREQYQEQQKPRNGSARQPDRDSGDQ